MTDTDGLLAARFKATVGGEGSGDWNDVLRRWQPRRAKHRRALAVAVAAVAVLVPATFAFGGVIRDLFFGTPAPPTIKSTFSGHNEMAGKCANGQKVHGVARARLSAGRRIQGARCDRGEDVRRACSSSGLLPLAVLASAGLSTSPPIRSIASAHSAAAHATQLRHLRGRSTGATAGRPRTPHSKCSADACTCRPQPCSLTPRTRDTADPGRGSILPRRVPAQHENPNEDHSPRRTRTGRRKREAVEGGGAAGAFLNAGPRRGSAVRLHLPVPEERCGGSNISAAAGGLTVSVSAERRWRVGCGFCRGSRR